MEEEEGDAEMIAEGNLAETLNKQFHWCLCDSASPNEKFSVIFRSS